MAASDRNGSKPMRSSYAPASQRSMRESELNKKARSSIANPNPSAGSSSFQKQKQSTDKRQSDSHTEESHISVYVRCRSRNDREIKENSGVVVSTMGHLGKEVVLQTGPMSVSNKTYTFDRVFGAESDQEMVYDGIASSVLDEMLQGYNCTVFAYGQTGTGKTHTMSGDIEMNGSQLSENAGIIPRTLVALFKQLEKNPEFSVKISFIELYNEELRDLLVQNETGERKVRIFEEPTKKSIVVQGMEEIFIKSATEGMKVLANGSYKRQVAATQCNDLSSRSHTVFTITVHMKEIDPISGEEYLKIGKLNLVDLAGSENITRSGAENKRAREAGMINQSLLTLGRVINSLVDQSPHIPYRESKLTRLLQDSLGGKTKTCIIATISPAKVSLEETISTLEYANRAKNIKNKPQVNSSMSKKMLIREYVQEIERLRNDLDATRSKNGIYLTDENWREVTAESESRRILVNDQKLRMDVLEDQIKKFKSNFEAQLEQLNEVERDLKNSKKQCEETNGKLDLAHESLNKTKQQLLLEEFVSSEYKATENELFNIGSSFAELLDEVVQSQDNLHEVILRKTKLEEENVYNLDAAKKMIGTHIGTVSSEIQQLNKNSTELSNVLNHNFTSMVESQKVKTRNSCEGLNQISNYYETFFKDTIEGTLKRRMPLKLQIEDFEDYKQELKSQLIKEFEDWQADDTNSSRTMRFGVDHLVKLIDEAFDRFVDHIQPVLNIVNEQMDRQVSEIKELCDRTAKHHAKYSQMLNDHVLKLEKYKETEKERENLGKQKLLENITSLVNLHFEERNERIDAEINSMKPELEAISQGQQDFTTKFNDFVNGTWIKAQTRFQQNVQEQADQLKENVHYSRKIINEEGVSQIINQITENEKSQATRFDMSVSKLDEELVRFTKFAESLKDLNEENTVVTTNKLTKVKAGLVKSFNDISESFKEFAGELQETKPQLVDDFLQKQSKYFTDFQTSTLQSIDSLNKYVSSVSYLQDDENPPKRQKIEINKNLPKSRTRQQIETLHHEEIYGMSNEDGSHSLNAKTDTKPQSTSPIPIPDKPFKQPLATSTRDLNIIRANSNEKPKSKPRSRPSSSLSQRSV